MNNGKGKDDLSTRKKREDSGDIFGRGFSFFFFFSFFQFFLFYFIIILFPFCLSSSTQKTFLEGDISFFLFSYFILLLFFFLFVRVLVGRHFWKGIFLFSFFPILFFILFYYYSFSFLFEF